MFITVSDNSIIIGDRAIVGLAATLEINTGLEMLLIADNPFGDEGGQQLTSVLCRTNQTLRVLDLHGTHMTKTVEREVNNNNNISLIIYYYHDCTDVGSARFTSIQFFNKIRLCIW